MTSPLRAARGSPFALSLKRMVDIVGAALGLVLAGPLMLLIALVIRLSLGAPVLFRQARPGLHGEPFVILKFRTMRDPEVGAEGDEERLTAVGRLLRRTSLDELPELINVLKGEMSLVGPRPLLMEYLDLYSPEQARRHEVRPGMTGRAQTKGRNALTWEEKFEHDVWYVDHRSLCVDLKILISTVVVVAGGGGVSQPGQATVEYFKGTPEPESPAGTLSERAR